MKSNHSFIEYPIINTPRMILRELTLEDVREILTHFSDPMITEFMDIEPCKSIEEAEEIIQFHLEDIGCRWGLFLKTSNELIGTCGYHSLVIKNESKAEIGFDLSKSYWGQGLMKEALVSVIHYGFDVMMLKMIEATVEQDNIRSQKLLKRLNFTRSEELMDGLFYYYIMKPSLNDIQ